MLRGNDGTIMFALGADYTAAPAENEADVGCFDMSQFTCVDVRDLVDGTATNHTTEVHATEPAPAAMFIRDEQRAAWVQNTMKKEEHDLLLTATESLVARKGALSGPAPLVPPSGLRNNNDELLPPAELLDLKRFGGTSLSVEAQSECRDALLDIIRQYAPAAR